MSISDIRAFFADRSQVTDLSRQQRSQAEIQSNRQGVGVQGSRVSLSTNLSISSQSFIGARVLTNGFNQSLNVNEQRPNFNLPSNERTGFDFEEVARNVLSFVGGVIRGAQARGEDEDELIDLFAQARRGVERGIGQAIEDLEGFLDDDLEEGIENSRNLIEEGIADLERSIFGTQPQQVLENETRIEQTISVSDQRSGDLRIRTRDGDEVRIRFEDIERFQQSQSLLLQTRQAQESNAGNEVEQNSEQLTEQPSPSAQDIDVEEAQVADETPSASGLQENQTPLINVQAVPQGIVNAESNDDSDEESTSLVDDSPSNAEQESSVVEQTISAEQSSLFFESSSFSFSVEGELDEDELRAIGELVSNTVDLADEFFNGDVDLAFEQALELGFDETELTGFALQLDSVQQTRITQTYESVSQFSDSNNEGEQERVSSVRPVADYLSDLLSVFDQSRQLLQSREVFDDLINDVFNRVLQIQTPDLVNALNRFNGFNERLLSNAEAAINRDV